MAENWIVWLRWYCFDRKSRAACAQSFALWQQTTIEIMLAISLTIACSRYLYNGVILHAHPVRGESHNQRNTTGEVATVSSVFDVAYVVSSVKVVSVGVGRGGGATGPSSTPGFWKVRQQRLFFEFRGVKNKFHHFWPLPGNVLEKSPSGPPWKKSVRHPR